MKNGHAYYSLVDKTCVNRKPKRKYIGILAKIPRRRMRLIRGTYSPMLPGIMTTNSIMPAVWLREII